MKDTAQEVASLRDLLYSAGNRIKIAEILIDNQRFDLIPTVLEDFAHGAMYIFEHCIKEIE